jgi:hypothetical protein
MRKGELERRDTLKKAQDAQEQKKEEELEAISLPTLFPDSMGNLLLVNIDTVGAAGLVLTWTLLVIHSTHIVFVVTFLSSSSFFFPGLLQYVKRRKQSRASLKPPWVQALETGARRLLQNPRPERGPLRPGAFPHRPFDPGRSNP